MTPSLLFRRLGPIGIAVLVVAGAGCSDPAASESQPPAVVEAINEDLARVQLTEAAVARLQLETDEAATRQMRGETRLTIPYASVIYHFDGTTWTYASDEPNVFVRAPIDIDFIEGDTAVLVSGPDVGTTVATVGTAELYGAEFGIGK